MLLGQDWGNVLSLSRVGLLGGRKLYSRMRISSTRMLQANSTWKMDTWCKYGRSQAAILFSKHNIRELVICKRLLVTDCSWYRTTISKVFVYRVQTIVGNWVSGLMWRWNMYQLFLEIIVAFVLVLNKVRLDHATHRRNGTVGRICTCGARAGSDVENFWFCMIQLWHSDFDGWLQIIVRQETMLSLPWWWTSLLMLMLVLMIIIVTTNINNFSPWSSRFNSKVFSSRSMSSPYPYSSVFLVFSWAGLLLYSQSFLFLRPILMIHMPYHYCSLSSVTSHRRHTYSTPSRVLQDLLTIS